MGAVVRSFKGPSTVRRGNMSTRKCIGRSTEALTRVLGMARGRVLFASNKARSGGLTLVNNTLTGGQDNGRVVAATVRRTTIDRPMTFLRRRKFRIAVLPMSKRKMMGLSTLRGTLEPSAVLMSAVVMGGRANTIVPMRGVNTVVRRGYPGTLCRMSTVRTFNGCHVCPGG